MNELVNLISMVGFPIVACIILFYFNKVEITELRKAIEKNTEVLSYIEDAFRMIDRRRKDDD